MLALLVRLRAIQLRGVHHATTLTIDNTGSMVVTLARQTREAIAARKLVGTSFKDVRTGVNATAVLLETVSGTVVLFFNGRHHAGGIFDGILACRKPAPGAPRLVRVTDAASKRFEHQRRKEVVDAFRNVHAFFILRDVKDKHPAEHAQAGGVYKAVFDKDDEAKRRRTPNERMLFHRERPMPLMEKLKAMCVEKLTSKLVESSSAFWAPLSFIISQ